DKQPAVDKNWNYRVGGHRTPSPGLAGESKRPHSTVRLSATVILGPAARLLASWLQSAGKSAAETVDGTPATRTIRRVSWTAKR
ncbi:MAG: hypothetical protein ACK53L_18035, partial [Pirellulaceae bacterium]